MGSQVDETSTELVSTRDRDVVISNVAPLRPCERVIVCSVTMYVSRKVVRRTPGTPIGPAMQPLVTTRSSVSVLDTSDTQVVTPRLNVQPVSDLSDLSVATKPGSREPPAASSTAGAARLAIAAIVNSHDRVMGNLRQRFNESQDAQYHHGRLCDRRQDGPQRCQMGDETWPAMDVLEAHAARASGNRERTWVRRCIAHQSHANASVWDAGGRRHPLRTVGSGPRSPLGPASAGGVERGGLLPVDSGRRGVSVCRVGGPGGSLRGGTPACCMSAGPHVDGSRAIIDA